jgi:hypothetical protein
MRLTVQRRRKACGERRLVPAGAITARAHVYPPEHAGLARRVEAAGALRVPEVRTAVRRLPGNRYERC